MHKFFTISHAHIITYHAIKGKAKNLLKNALIAIIYSFFSLNLLQAQEGFEATPAQKESALEIVSNLTNAMKERLKGNDQNNEENTADFYVFVSSSISDRALKHLIADTKKYDGIVVIRGLIQNNIRKTVAYLNRFISEDGEGVIIDPTLFMEYKVKTVPTFVLSKKEQNCGASECEAKYDVLTGMVTPYFALSKFSQSGSLKLEAKERLAE